MSTVITNIWQSRLSEGLVFTIMKNHCLCFGSYGFSPAFTQTMDTRLFSFREEIEANSTHVFLQI